MRWLSAISLGFVVYGSLIPFESSGLGFSRAVDGLFSSRPLSHEVRSLADWAVNLALYFPAAFFLFGALSHRARGLGGWIGLWFAVVMACGGVSMLVEFAQAFVAGRVSSLLDVARNAVGAAFGPLAWALVGPALVRAIGDAFSPNPQIVPWWFRRVAVWGALPYLLLLLIANGLMSVQFRDGADVLAMVVEVRWLPFVHHFESGFVRSVASLLRYSLLYFPAGVIALGLLGGTRGGAAGFGMRIALVIVFVLALSVELGKLLIEGLRPDTSNVVIALAAATLGWATARWSMGSRQSREAVAAGTSGPASVDDIQTVAGRHVVLGATALVMALLGIGIAVTSPVAPWALLFGLVAYALLLVRHEAAWLIVLPALLPVLDLTPWTGVRLLTEFDAFVAVSLAFGMWRARQAVVGPRIRWPMRAGFFLLAVSYAASLIIGAWPLQPIDHAAFTDPFSRYAALPPVKAFLSALLLVWLARESRKRGSDVARLFTAGMLVGLAGVVAVSLWERVAYPGLFDFNREFRIAASFSSMNTGGGAVEAYLVMAIPFIAAGMLMFRSWAVRGALIGLLLLSSYALTVTYARAGYGGFAVGCLVLAAAFMLTRGNLSSRLGVRFWALPVALVAVAAVIVAPVMSARFAQSRLASIGDDWQTRVSHWREVQAIMPRDFGAQLFGMGLGRFPETYFFEGKGARPSAPFRFQTETGNTFLRLGVGAPLYVDQIVPIEPATKYELSLQARSVTGSGVVNVLLCERTFFYSAGCESAVVKLEGESGRWARHEAVIESRRLGATPWYAHRPVKLSIENASSNAAIDVDEVRLQAPGGGNSVDNGDFERGGARWFYSSAHNHLPWHIKNLPLELLFGQGWFGVVAFAIFLVSVVGRLLASEGVFSSVVLAAFAGFLAVGIFDSLLDAPRLLTLFYMTAGVAAIAVAQPLPRVGAERRQGRSDVAAVASGHARPASGSPIGHAASGVDFRWPWAHVAGCILLLTAGAWLVTNAPFVPYNLRELPNPSRPLFSLLLLSVFVYWTAAMPVLIANRLARVPVGAALVVPALLMHGVIAWTLVHLAVLPESIHDVVGTPVLGWPWEWERLGRFVALMLMVSVGLGTGALLVSVLQRAGSVLAAVNWLIGVVILAPLSYWIVVLQAGTDNLVELMADHGAFWAWSGLVAWGALIGVNSSAIAAWIAKPRAPWFAVCGGVTLAAPVLGWALLSAATAEAVTFERQTFSALQFMLSMDRRHLAQGGELVLRYVIVHGLVVAVLALVQYPAWRLAFRK